MTACVDNKTKKGGAAKAVSATLAGVLAVGMVPAAAFATEGDQVPVEGDSAELLGTVTAADAFSNGKTTAAVDNDGNTVADPAKVTFTADGDAHYAVPTEIRPEGPNAEAISLLNADGTLNETDYTFYLNSCTIDPDTGAVTKTGGLTSGVANFSSHTVNPGSYYVAVTRNADGATLEEALVFTIEPASLDGAYIYEVDGDSLVDTTITYTGSAFGWGTGSDGNLNIAVGDKALKAGTDYTVSFKESVGAGIASVQNAGTYTVTVTGQGIYAGQTKEITLVVNKLDLSNAKITFDKAGTIKSINGSATLIGKVQAKQVSGPTAPTVGACVYKVVPTDTQNLTGSQNVNVDRYTTDVTVKYQAKDWGAPQSVADGSTMTINYRNGDSAFDASGIIVLAGTQQMASSYYDVKYYDKDWNEVSAADVTEPGTWHVAVTAKASAMQYDFGGTVVFNLNVTDGTITAADEVFVTFDGETMTGTHAVDYDGTNQADKLAVAVVIDDNGTEKTLTEGTDYTVKCTDSNGDEVSEAVNVGTYTFTIEGKNYTMAPETFTLTIDPANASTLRIANPTVTRDGHEMVAATGESIEIAVEYQSGTDDNGDPIWSELPSDAFKVVNLQKYNSETKKWEKVDEVLGGGFYGFAIEDSGNGTQADDNYTVARTSIWQSTPAFAAGKFGVSGGYFYVTDAKIFADVPEGEWFSNDIYTAVDENYINGYQGTNLFGPNDTLSRGQAASVLYRMAGGSIGSNLLDYVVAEDIPFSDVDNGLYYTKPIVWAETAGIINGYGDTGLFMPNQDVTREQFCKMLYAYAQATDQVGDKTEADLTAFPDDDAVSSWATEAVEWAVANDLFGSAGVLNPQGTITRAEMAKMIVALQPEQLTIIAPNQA